MPDDLKYESKFVWLARFGFVTRGLLYIVIAWLVIANGRTEDLTGAMEYLGYGVGRGLMIFLVAGMTGYGLWRVSDAAFGMDSGRHHAKAWRRRVAAATSGGIYLFLAYKALRIMLGERGEVGGVRQNAAKALHLPAGDLALGIAAAVLALDTLRGPLQFPVAAGLALFGLYSLVEARYRSIHKPPTEHVKRKVKEAVA
jgi:hypothetical protein